jgi:hypothetical protein
MIFGALLYFIHILEVYTNFWNFKRNRETKKTHTMSGRPFGPWLRPASPAQPRKRRTCMVTAPSARGGALTSGSTVVGRSRGHASEHQGVSRVALGKVGWRGSHRREGGARWGGNGDHGDVDELRWMTAVVNGTCSTGEPRGSETRRKNGQTNGESGAH